MNSINETICEIQTPYGLMKFEDDNNPRTVLMKNCSLSKPLPKAIKILEKFSKPRVNLMTQYHVLYDVLDLMLCSVRGCDQVWYVPCSLLGIINIDFQLLRTTEGFVNTKRILSNMLHGYEQERAVVWSNHDDFDVFKRVQFRYKESGKPVMINSIHDFWKHAKHYSMAPGNFHFMNSKNFYYRFNKRNFHNFDFMSVVDIMMSCVRQKMTLLQAAKLSSIVTTMDMKLGLNDMRYFEDYIIQYHRMCARVFTNIVCWGNIQDYDFDVRYVAELYANLIGKIDVLILHDGEFEDENFVYATHKDFIMQALEQGDNLEYRSIEYVDTRIADGLHGAQIKNFQIVKEDIHVQTEKEGKNWHRIAKVLSSFVRSLWMSNRLDKALLEAIRTSRSIRRDGGEFLDFHPKNYQNFYSENLKIDEVDGLFYLKTFEAISGNQFTNLKHSGLNKHFEKLEDIEFPADCYLPSMRIKYLVENHPGHLAFLKNSEAMAKSLFMYLDTDEKYTNLFSHTDFFDLFVEYLKQRNIPIPHTGKNPLFHPLAWVQTKYEQIKSLATDTLDSVKNTSTNVDEAMISLRQSAIQFSERMDRLHNTHIAGAMRQCDFTTFTSSFSSVKIVISSLFNEIVSKICGLLGVEYNTQLDAHVLFLYYILWKNTDCKYTRMFIVLDIMAMAGILDVVWGVLTFVFSKLKQFTEAVIDTHTNDRPIDRLLAKLDTQKIEEQHIEKCNVTDSQPDVMTTFDSLIDAFMNNQTRVIAVVATGALLYFGVKHLTVDTVEKKMGLVKTLPLVALSLGAIPKIFSNILGMVTFIVDQIKGIVSAKHTTQLQFTNRVIKFLTTNVFQPGISEGAFFENLTYCFAFNKAYAEMMELKRMECKISDPSLRAAFVEKRKEMEKMYPICKSAIAMQIPRVEMIHMQLYSPPGTGKTDLSKQVMREMIDTYRKHLNVTFEKAGLKKEDWTEDFSYYSSNDALKHSDNLYDQVMMYVDEEGMTNEIDYEIVITKMMMSSGNPVISQQADLTAKGRIIPTLMKVSNTNNPFHAPKDMLTKEAYYRRRILFEARINPEFLDGEGKLIEDKLTPLDRTMGCHLQVKWRDSVNQNSEAHPEAVASGVNWMTVPDFLQLVSMLTRRHFIVEENRMNIKDPVGNWIRLKSIRTLMDLHAKIIDENPDMTEFKNNINEMRKRISERNKNNVNAFKAKVKEDDMTRWSEIQDDIRRFREGNYTEEDMLTFTRSFFSRTENTRLFIDHMREVLDQYTSTQYIDTTILVDAPGCKHEPTIDVRTETLCKTCVERTIVRIMQYQRALKHLSTASDFLAPVNYTALKKLLTFNLPNPHTNFLKMEDSFVHYGLAFSNGRAYIVNSHSPMRIRPGNIEWQNVKCEKVNGLDKVVYHCSEEEYTRNQVHILYHLVDVSTLTSQSAVEAHVRIQLADNIEQTSADKFFDKIRVKMNRWMEAGRSALENIMSGMFSFISESVLRGIGIVISVFAMFSLLSVIGRVLCGNPSVDEHAAYTSRNKKPRNSDSVILHSQIPDTPSDTAHYTRGCIKIFASNHLGDTSCWFNATNVGGNVYLVNHHAFSLIDKTNIHYAVNLFKHSVDPEAAWQRVNIGQKVAIENADAGLIVIKDYRSARSLFSKFLTDLDIQQHEIDFGNCNANILMYRVNRIKDTKDEYKNYSIMELNTGYVPMSSTTINNGQLAYSLNTTRINSKLRPVPGDSGSLVFHDNTHIQHKILGIHVGNSHYSEMYSYCAIVTQEMITKAMNQISHEDKIRNHAYNGQPLPDDHELKKVVKYDILQSSFLPDQSISKDSGFRRTGKFSDKITTYPAIQSSRDPRIVPGTRHHMYVSLNKDNGDKIPYIHTDEEPFLVSVLTLALQENWNWSTTRIYDVDTAVNGGKKPGSTPIDIHTAAGLPYKLEPGTVGKQPFIYYSPHQERRVISQRIYDDVERKISQFENAQTSPDFKLEFRKHELVGMNKIENPKTRVVGMGNIPDQIIYDMTNKDLHTGLKSVYRTGSASSFVTGLNMEIHGQQILDYIKYHDFVLDYDVVAWEEKMSRQLLRLVAKAKTNLINAAYRSRGEKPPPRIYEIFISQIDDFVYSNVVYETTIRPRFSGMLSGWPGTLVDNTSAHIMIVALIARRCLLAKGLKHLANPNWIRNNVRMIAAADDVLLALSPLARNYITTQDIVNGYKEMTYDLTAPDKSPNISAKSIWETEFLKHTFYRDGDEVKTKIMEKVIYQLLAYVRSDTKLPYFEQLSVNIANALRFAYWHGRDFYENLRERINHDFANDGYSNCLTYDDMRVQIEHYHEIDEYEYKHGSLDGDLVLVE